MKYLYVSTKDLEGLCKVKKQCIDDFIYNGERFYCTELEDVMLSTNQVRFQFILNSYKFNILLAHIKHEEIPIFINWRDRFFPNTRTYINVYKTNDIGESLYLLKTDHDLNITGYFFKKFIPVLKLITSMADITPV